MCRGLEGNADLFQLVGLQATWHVAQLGDRETRPAMASDDALILIERLARVVWLRWR